MILARLFKRICGKEDCGCKHLEGVCENQVCLEKNPQCGSHDNRRQKNVKIRKRCLDETQQAPDKGEDPCLGNCTCDDSTDYTTEDNTKSSTQGTSTGSGKPCACGKTVEETSAEEVQSDTDKTSGSTQNKDTTTIESDKTMKPSQKKAKKKKKKSDSNTTPET